jgi:hypothetical protein
MLITRLPCLLLLLASPVRYRVQRTAVHDAALQSRKERQNHCAGQAYEPEYYRYRVADLHMQYRHVGRAPGTGMAVAVDDQPADERGEAEYGDERRSNDRK